MKKIILLLLLFMPLTLGARSLDYEKMEISLLSIGPGDELFFRWGHSCFVVKIPGRTPALYDYGVFSFEQEDFFINFAQGIMNYTSSRSNAAAYIKHITGTNRSLTEQVLDLTPRQKKQIYEMLLTSLRPENRIYAYDHYKNNCVTRLTDFLDEVTDGQYYKGSEVSTGRTFRDFSRDYLYNDFPLSAFISFVQGGKTDREITIKESLFLPWKTKEWTDSVVISDEAGTRNLVKETNIIYEAVGRIPVEPNSPKGILRALAAGLVFMILLLLLKFLAEKKKFIEKIYALLLTFSGLIGGLMGSLLFFMSFFSGHYYIHNNWNLILISPLCFFLIIIGIKKLRGKKSAETLKTGYFNIIALACLIVIILKLTGIIIHENGDTLALLLPAVLAESSLCTLIKSRIKKSSAELSTASVAV